MIHRYSSSRTLGQETAKQPKIGSLNRKSGATPLHRFHDHQNPTTPYFVFPLRSLHVPCIRQRQRYSSRPFTRNDFLNAESEWMNTWIN